MIIPIFRIFDYDKAVEFYINWLEFKIDWEDNSSNLPLYIQISKDNLIIHLSEHHGDCSPGGKIFIEFKNLKAFHKILSQKNYKFYNPAISKPPWGGICMELIDPFNNRLLFNEKFSD